MSTTISSLEYIIEDAGEYLVDPLEPTGTWSDDREHAHRFDDRRLAYEVAERLLPYRYSPIVENVEEGEE
jgi:hypothetical protein